MRARNKHANELAELGNDISRRIVNQHTAVNVGSLRLHSSLPQQLTFVRFAFEQDAHSFADARSVLATRNPCLFIHQLISASLCDLRIDFIWTIESRRPFVG